ncbi:ras-related protein Rab-18 [Rhodotorula toruloides]|uniref:Ras-related protein Rab-18 n=1 Tax=Rhodotorula toruloides TaxID=5286 RepID=A0A511KAU0_RHOTO|nr:ras-related protein Rab-18 [Rhodotorula toruloides]
MSYSTSSPSAQPSFGQMTEPPQTLKILVIGASSVGKSSLLLRFTDETFLSPDETSATIGVDFKVKVIERKNKRWKLSIWVWAACIRVALMSKWRYLQDTAGQERFRTLTSSYYRGAQGVILVYDITARDTFESLSSWINELDTFAGTGPASREVVRMIVGNKVDKEFSRTVSTAEGQAFAASRDPPWLFMECSAKKGGDDVSGDDGIFGKVVDRIIATPSLYTKVAPSTTSSSAKRQQAGGPPGQFPGRNGGTVNLDEEMQGGSGWCSC